jgi:Carboxypeptidase regulatory-like domain
MTDKTLRDRKDAPSSGSITGKVMRAHGEPVAEVAVMVAGNSPTHHDLAALTNSEGEYELTSLPPGNYRILINAHGHAPRIETVQVPAGARVRLDVTLQD